MSVVLVALTGIDYRSLAEETRVRKGDCNPWINGTKWKSIAPPLELILFLPQRNITQHVNLRWLYYSMTASNIKGEISGLNWTTVRANAWPPTCNIPSVSWALFQFCVQKNQNSEHLELDNQLHLLCGCNCHLVNLPAVQTLFPLSRPPLK